MARARSSSHGPVSLDAAVSTIRRRMVPSGPIRVTTTLISSVCPLRAHFGRQTTAMAACGHACPVTRLADCRKRDHAPSTQSRAPQTSPVAAGRPAQDDTASRAARRRRTAKRKITAEYLRRLGSLVLALDQYRSSNSGRPRLCAPSLYESAPAHEAGEERTVIGSAPIACASRGIYRKATAVMTSTMSRGVSSAEGASQSQRTTRTVLPGRRARPPLSKACRPSASGKVWPITARSLPAPAISASLASSLASGSTMKTWRGPCTCPPAPGPGARRG